MGSHDKDCQKERRWGNGDNCTMQVLQNGVPSRVEARDNWFTGLLLYPWEHHHHHNKMKQNEELLARIYEDNKMIYEETVQILWCFLIMNIFPFLLIMIVQNTFSLINSVTCLINSCIK